MKAILSCLCLSLVVIASSADLEEGFHHDLDDTAISAGEVFSCVLERVEGEDFGGALFCWGENRAKQLHVPEGIFIQVSVGYNHGCAVSIDERVVCWGETANAAPTDPFVQVSSGAFHACGIRKDAGIECWGNCGEELCTPPEGTYAQVSCAKYHCCGIHTDGTLSCWGDNTHNVLDTPTGEYVQVSAADSGYSCAVSMEATLVCWGKRYEEPVEYDETKFTQVTASRSFFCALTEHSTTKCWGQARDVWRSPDAPPQDTQFLELSSAGQKMCAITVQEPNTAMCFGTGKGIAVPVDLEPAI